MSDHNKFSGPGPEKSARARTVGIHGLGDATHEWTWDNCHQLDLGIEDAHTACGYVKQTIHPVIRALCGHYNGSPHEKRRLDLLAEAWGPENVRYRLRSLFEVRFVASEFYAIRAILISLPLVYEGLQNELDIVGISAEKSATLNGWLRQMRQFKFVAYLIVMTDVHKLNKVFSERMQSDSSCCIDAPDAYDQYMASLQKMALGELGSECQARLPELCEGKVKVLKRDAEELSEKEAATVMTGLELDDGDLATRPFSGASAMDESDAPGEEHAVKLVGASGDVEQRLKDYQKAFVVPLIAALATRPMEAQLATPRKLSKIFDFRKMPLVEGAAAAEELLTWSDKEVEEFIPSKFPLMDLDIFKSQALAARMYVQRNQKQWIVPKDSKKPEDGRILLLTGPGSICETLFSRSDICGVPINLYLVVMDYMISYAWQSACVERLGSHLCIVMTKYRTLMRSDTLCSTLFNKFNLPEVHEVDLDALAKAWKVDKRVMGVFKGCDGSEPSKVVARHLTLKGKNFLFKNMKSD